VESADTFNAVDLLEVKIDHDRVASFDGRVLEVFGGSVRRFHVQLLSVTVAGPDKKGNRDVTLTQSGRDNAVPLDEAQFDRFQPPLDALKAAGVDVDCP
jgi:hypothetical protein